jgi:hypothetical protein
VPVSVSKDVQLSSRGGIAGDFKTMHPRPPSYYSKVKVAVWIMKESRKGAFADSLST